MNPQQNNIPRRKSNIYQAHIVSSPSQDVKEFVGFFSDSFHGEMEIGYLEQELMYRMSQEEMVLNNINNRHVLCNNINNMLFGNANNSPRGVKSECGEGSSSSLSRSVKSESAEVSSLLLSEGETKRTMDPKREKRMLSNNESARRSRARELDYIKGLEEKSLQLESHVSALVSHVNFVERRCSELSRNKSVVKQRMANLSREINFKNAKHESLRRKMKMLKHLQQNAQNMQNPIAPNSKYFAFVRSHLGINE